jgi:hypothetical protein
MGVLTHVWTVQMEAWDPTFLTRNLHRIFFEFLEAHFWNQDSKINDIPDYVATLHKSDFVKQNIANHKLTNSLFGHSGTKITWPVQKYNSSPKQKILPIFVSKGQRVNRVNKNKPKDSSKVWRKKENYKKPWEEHLAEKGWEQNKVSPFTSKSAHACIQTWEINQIAS